MGTYKIRGHPPLTHICLGLHRTSLITSGPWNYISVTQLVSVVVCLLCPSDSRDPSVLGDFSHFLVLLPLLLDKSTPKPRCKIGWTPSTAL